MTIGVLPICMDEYFLSSRDPRPSPYHVHWQSSLGYSRYVCICTKICRPEYLGSCMYLEETTWNLPTMQEFIQDAAMKPRDGRWHTMLPILSRKWSFFVATEPARGIICSPTWWFLKFFSSHILQKNILFTYVCLIPIWVLLPHLLRVPWGATDLSGEIKRH
jgi:hypothetical protein